MFVFYFYLKFRDKVSILINDKVSSTLWGMKQPIQKVKYTSQVLCGNENNLIELIILTILLLHNEHKLWPN